MRKIQKVRFWFTLLVSVCLFYLLIKIAIPVPIVCAENDTQYKKYTTMRVRVGEVDYKLGLEVRDQSQWKSTWYWIDGARHGNVNCKAALDKSLPEWLVRLCLST